MRRLEEPLNPDAVAAADAELARITGGRKLTMGPEDAELRKKWVDAYLAAGGKERKKKSSKKVSSHSQPCPKKTWVEVQYMYVSGKGVPGANYSVADSSGGQLASGILDQNGFAHVDGLPDGLSGVTYSFDNDPPDYKIFPEYQPMPNPYTPPDPGYIDEAGQSGKLKDVALWLWGAIEGDFNEDPSLGQIAAGTVITLIPVVDQIGDVRDLVANLKKLVWDGRYDEFFVWVGVVLTAIGCFPEIGSAVKGVLKALEIEGIKLFRLIKKLNFIGEGNAVRWLRELSGKLPELGVRAGRKIVEILDHYVGKLVQLKRYLRGKALEQIDRLLETIGKVKGMTGEMTQKVISYFKKKLDALLEDSARIEKAGSTETKNILQQESEALREGTKAAEEGEKKLKELGLGLKSKKKNLDYKQWAEDHGWSTYADLGGRGSFSEQIDRAMNDADKIHFNLDGVDVSKASGKLNEYGEPAMGYTNYELHMLKSHPEYAAKVTWYRDGAAMPKGWSPF